MHAPLADAAAAQGAQLAFDRPLATRLHLDRARLVLAVGADPFSHHAGAVRHAADWAKQRAQGQAAQLVALETAPGLFGARADRRHALPPRRIEALLWRIAAELVGDMPSLPDTEAALAGPIVRALREAGPASLIVPGPTLSAESHALVHLLHQRLGAFGRTLDLIAASDAAPGAGSLDELVQAMHAGQVDTLLVLGANPAYDAPAELRFEQALDRVPLTVHHGRCRWHLPQSHAYEQWSDALAFDGSATLIQPAIAPLYDSRSAHELLAASMDDGEHSGHRLVRRQWQAHAGRDFEAFWRDSLRRGVVEGSAFAPVAAPVVRLPSPPAALRTAASDIELVFVADASVHDGSYANNAWLQELPRPFSKITWDNALQLGPATARALGVQSGDVVSAQAGAGRIEVPVWVQAGHAEGAASLALGQGRRQSGRVGNGVGVDAYALRPPAAWHTDVRLQRTASHHAFARTQREMAQHGRDLARVLPAGQAMADPSFSHPSLYPPDACIGCNACTIACQAENNIPVVGRDQVARGREMHWIRVDRYDSDEPGGSVFQPVPCMHCENAPCELVCPVGATVHDSEGLNVQVYNRCIGTRFCSNNCPYKVRRFNFLPYTDATTETLKAQRNPDVTVRQRGVMEKCSYCIQRIARARQHAEASGRSLVDGDVVTACQAVCPTRAIHFGDLADARSDVVGLQASPRHYALLGELNTRPRTTYLARVAAKKAEPT